MKDETIADNIADVTKVKTTFIVRLAQKIEQQGLSFMLLTVYVVISQIQIANLDKQKTTCDDYVKNTLFKAIEANTIVIQRSNDDHDELINRLNKREYEDD